MEVTPGSEAPDSEAVADTSAELELPVGSTPEVSEAAGPVVDSEAAEVESAEAVEPGRVVLSARPEDSEAGRPVELADSVEVRLSLGTTVSDGVSVTEGSTTEVLDPSSVEEVTGTVLEVLVQLKVLKVEEEDEVDRELVHGSDEAVVLEKCLICISNLLAEAPLTQARTARLRRLRAILCINESASMLGGSRY